MILDDHALIRSKPTHQTLLLISLT